MNFPPPERSRSGQQTPRQLPRMCNDYNRRGGCTRANCQELHLCTYFLQNRCTAERCNKAHALETPRNILLLEGLGWQGSDDLALALDILRRRARGQAVSVCVMYNVGSCSVPNCGRLHICYRRVVNACPLDDCGLSHDLLDGGHNAELLASAGLTDTPVTELLRRLQEQMRRRPPQPALCRAVNGRQGCQRHCLRLHYCEAFLHSRCRFGDRCSKSHSLKDRHNQRVLTFFGWTEEQVLEALRKDRVGRSASRPARARTPTERDDDEERSDRQDLCEGSQQGPSAETRVKRVDSAEEVANHVNDLVDSSNKQPKRHHKLCEQTARVRPKAQEDNVSEQQKEAERQQWERKETEWKEKEREWKNKEAEWQNKEVEWQQKENEWQENERKRARETQLREKETREIEIRAPNEVADIRKEERTLQRLRQAYEKEKEVHLKAMTEKESREKELMVSFAKLAIDYERNQKTMSTIQQINADYQRQIASMQTLVKELKDKDQGRQIKAKTEEEDMKKKTEELTELRELVRKQKGYVECSVCLGTFVEPVTLECAHTFCKNCIENTPRPAGGMYHFDHLHPLNQNQRRQCPLCRRVASVQVPSLALKNISGTFSGDQQRATASATSDARTGRTARRPRPGDIWFAYGAS
ncbi:E3 ubiquitin-protein ligase bre1-like [Amphibalanus amphitrite]|uniref:E3 ubiquitin-protein ligase bre1-like n=1 Tax=Amphibalanus amphitrite TaxID=1232801 RepID=UPI001C9031E4|nr:E3 ubiquitin-protein ligase bre1-like [Amphibalanus amphitrite]